MPHPYSEVTAHHTIAQLFFEQAMRERGLPLLWKHDGPRLLPYTRNEAAEWITSYARGLQALQIARGARIGLVGAPAEYRLPLLLAHALLGITTVVISEDASPAERLDLLRQSHCVAVLVETASEAAPCMQDDAGLSELNYVICLGEELRLASKHATIIPLAELMRRGRSVPDRSAQMLGQTRQEDAALIVGSAAEIDDARDRVLTMKTHGDLLNTCARLSKLLFDAQIDLPPGAPILAHPNFHESAAFIATQLLPLTLDGSIDYLGQTMEDVQHFRLFQPLLLIADSTYLHRLQARLENQLLVEADPIDRFGARLLFRLGKKRYEGAGKLPWWEEMTFWAARHAFSTRMREQLGRHLRGILCVDENLDYSTLLFFETFGVRVVEIPSVFDATFEKRRL